MSYTIGFIGMTPLTVETIARKFELIYVHRSEFWILVSANVVALLWGWAALVRIMRATAPRRMVSTAIYFVLLGAIASMISGLTHDMFHWGFRERLPFAVVALVLPIPPALTILLSADLQELNPRDRFKAMPALFLLVHFSMAFVYCFSPLTAVE